MTLLQSIVPRFNRLSRVPAPESGANRDARIKPLFSLREDDDAFEAVVQIPGVAKNGLEITAQEGALTIVGRRAWAPPASWTTLYRETARADYELVLAHSSEIDAEKISAELKNGVLRLTLPKAEAAKPRKIAVN